MTSAPLRGRPVIGQDAPRWVLARVLRATLGKVVLAAYRTRFVGASNVPASGAVLAGNHASYLDPVLLWCGAPRPTHFVAKAELWQVGWIGWLLDRLWAFPVARGSADRVMISTATGLLGRGELVGMFPEGTRGQSDSDELGAAHGGVAFIAMRAEVPVVPVGIAGTDKALPRGAKLPRFPKVVVSYGEPIDPKDFGGGRKERIEAMTEELMRRIARERDRAREAAS